MSKNLIDIYNKLLSFNNEFIFELTNINNKRFFQKINLNNYIIKLNTFGYDDYTTLPNNNSNIIIKLKIYKYDEYITLINKLDINDIILIKKNDKLDKYTYISKIIFFDINKYEYDYKYVFLINNNF